MTSYTYPPKQNSTLCPVQWRENNECNTGDSHRCDYEVYCLLGHEAVWFGRNLSTFLEKLSVFIVGAN